MFTPPNKHKPPNKYAPKANPPNFAAIFKVL